MMFANVVRMVWPGEKGVVRKSALLWRKTCAITWIKNGRNPEDAVIDFNMVDTIVL